MNDPTFKTEMAKVHQDPDQLAMALYFDPKRWTRRGIGFLVAESKKVH